MSTTVLNEHDANQGAQSKGEFLGMTGNCGWWLLGSAGASVMMVIVLWGVLGVSLLLCVLVGVVLCALSVTYVFTLKNNKPAHYDTDFFEAALVESGLIELAFGPRERRPANPFAVGAANGPQTNERAPRRERSNSTRARASASSSRFAKVAARKDDRAVEDNGRAKRPADELDATVSLGAYEKLQGELAVTQDELEAALAEREED